MPNWGAELRRSRTLYAGRHPARSLIRLAALPEVRSLPGRHCLRGEPSCAEPVISAALWPL